MNKTEALNFLSLHQPMPDDLDITQELIDQYDDVRQYFTENPDNDAIPLLMHSFGSGDGLGVYQLVEDVFYKCDYERVIENVIEILTDPFTIKSVRYWVTQQAVNFLDARLIDGLNLSLQSDADDICCMAEIALRIIVENSQN
ncbi:hypothetical protein [Pseudocitrobacter cyperus]|uniref:Uncharacterized protein n=1 Tax=Pseudocitrobacter cyperus TaxID=3112843 RepID=A0ABV0HG18_9ENTR